MYDKSKVQGIFDNIISRKDKVITEESAKEILSEYEIKVPRYALVNDVNESIKKANELGFPLVAKIVSPQILHKTDVGGAQKQRFVKLSLTYIRSCQTSMKLKVYSLKKWFHRVSN
ncbi:MAG: succinyl-CoA synthetase subunit alpha [Nitrososphaeraceae archaeon]|nr:succinyl-CoA synthetase subunit alpha [Nitrososphaeraceae archaeon]